MCTTFPCNLLWIHPLETRLTFQVDVAAIGKGVSSQAFAGREEKRREISAMAQNLESISIVALREL